MFTELSILGLPGGENIIETNYYLDVRVHTSALGETGIEGVVWEYPVSGIIGNKIGEFTLGSFEDSLDGQDRAVFKIRTSAFGGDGLGLLDTPLVLLRNGTKTTGIIEATIVEE